MLLIKLRKTVIIPLLILTLLGLPQIAGVEAAAADAAVTNETEQASDLDVLQEVLDYLDEYNIEGVDREQFIDEAVRGMVYSLDDPYSDYYTEEDMQNFEEDVNQEYVGIGVTLYFTDQKLYVKSVMADSPAGQEGVKAGDIVTKVDGQAVTGPDAIEQIQGKEDTKVLLTVDRDGKSLVFSVPRKHFVLPSVTGSLIPYSKIGYIAITSFSETADKEFEDKLNELRKTGIGALVLDLRDNLGGYVEAAENITKHFMKKGILMYTADQSGEFEPVEISGGEDIGMPVIILTNEMTASASEILTGALRDNGIATVIGAQTYGKARIQDIFPLSNGSSLKLTVERYLTPKKEDFNYNGLKPNIEVDNNAAAQLITGLYKAGLRRMDITGSSSALSVNGLSLPGYVNVIKSGGKIYVPSRLLTAMIQGNVSWSTSSKKLTVTDRNGHQTVFTLASKNVKFKDGETYIEMHDFRKKFPALGWNYHQDILSLSMHN